MQNMSIIIAIISAIFVFARDIIIKKSVKQSSEIVIIATHLIAIIVLTPFMVFQKISILSIKNLMLALLVTVSLTAVASIVRLNVIRKYDISLSSPLMGLVPIFMIPSNVFIMNEYPKPIAIIGIFISSIGVFILNFKSQESKSLILSKVSFLTIVVVIIHSITTTVDKIAIQASNAFTYTYLWILSTFIVMLVYVSITCSEQLKLKNIFEKNIIIQALFWVISFLSQAISIQFAMSIESGTTYIKTITMLNILFTTVLGGIIFKESNLLKRLLSAICVLVGSIIVIYTMK